jgi:hypothetical protein
MSLRDRALDSAVAEFVMGWTGIRPLAAGERAEDLLGIDPVSGVHQFVPPFSSTIAVAWGIVEHFVNEADASPEAAAVLERFRAAFARETRGDPLLLTAQDLALAISRAALEAVGATALA